MIGRGIEMIKTGRNVSGRNVSGLNASVLLALLLLAVSLVPAQVSSSRVTGIVTDKTGAVVAGVCLTVAQSGKVSGSRA